MWLSETAVDIETLDILAEHGIKFTILAPHQACRVKKIGGEKWKDVSGGRIDPTRAYLSNRQAAIISVFYDTYSRLWRLKNCLKGEGFTNRVNGLFCRKWPQILHIALMENPADITIGIGNMSLAFAFHYIESQGLARLTNYGEYSGKHPDPCMKWKY